MTIIDKLNSLLDNFYKTADDVDNNFDRLLLIDRQTYMLLRTTYDFERYLTHLNKYGEFTIRVEWTYPPLEIFIKYENDPSEKEIEDNFILGIQYTAMNGRVRYIYHEETSSQYR